MLNTLLFDLRVALVFVVMLTILVFAHEFGHYLFARLFGMGVEEFAIGFGRPRLGVYYRRRYRIPLSEEQADAWERGELEVPLPEGLPKMLEPEIGEEGELVRDPAGSYLDETTKFSVRAWPLGGFVRIRGMAPEAQGKETQVPGGFYSKPPWQRLIVLFAGPMFSVLAGLLILVPYLMVVGNPVPTHSPILGVVIPGSRGEAGGLMKNDKIVSIDGKPVSDFYEVIQLVRSHPEANLDFVVNREGKNLPLVLTPKRDTVPTQVMGPDLEPTDRKEIQGKLGIMSTPRYVPLAFGSAVQEAVLIPIYTVLSLADGVLHPATLKNEVGGPVSIVRSTAEATHDGLGPIIEMMATLSISLGIFNLLPIFPMDGGQMVVSFAELLRRGRRLSMQAQNVVATMGISALFMLVVGVLFIDFQRLHLGSSTKPASSTPK